MADKPSRALAIYGDGCASLVSSSEANLHAFASRASCGFLSLRSPPSPSSESEDDRVVKELAELLDAYDFYVTKERNMGKADAAVDAKEPMDRTISERFMGLRAAFLTSCPKVGPFARSLGFNVLQLQELVTETDSSESLPEANDALISKLLCFLGFSEGEVLEDYDFELVFLHVSASKKAKDVKANKSISNNNVDWLDKLVGGIMQTMHLHATIASRLHFSILLSYGTVSESDKRFSLISTSATESNSDLSLLCPLQSYTMKGGNVLDCIRHHHPILIGQWQEGVTRKDMASSFSFEEFKENGGSLAILADRFLYEVAFKLWKAPKYGA